MKGFGVERVIAAGKSVERDVNSSLRRSPSEGGESCQERVDTKAFTGRGSHHELRQLQAEVDRLDQQMRGLSAASKQVAGAQLYLMLHQRHATGYQFLRWRETGGSKRHLSWELAQQIYSAYQQRTRSWYAQLSEQAMKANDEHVRLRKEIRLIKRRLLKSQRAVYAKAIPG